MHAFLATAMRGLSGPHEPTQTGPVIVIQVHQQEVQLCVRLVTFYFVKLSPTTSSKT